jgi:glucokinase
MILAGDVGGTKTVLALYESGVGQLEKVKEATFPSAEFPSLDAICIEFLNRIPDVTLRVACFGVPGAVVDRKCKTTNLPWQLDESELETTLKVPRVKLLNDLQAGGFGMLHLEQSELSVLNPGRATKGNMAVIAAGTGLGEGMLFFDGEKYHPVASEGGHSTFAPQNDLEYELRRFLARRIGGDEQHVSWERVLSGPGLGNVYDFLKMKGVHEESPDVAAKIKAGADKGSVVGVEAMKGGDKLCTAAADMFASLYGAEAGNVALKFLATGGVFVGGGIAPKLLPVLQRGAFVKAFVDKGRFTGLLQNIPVHVALNDKAPLLGAAQYAAKHLLA